MNHVMTQYLLLSTLTLLLGYGIYWMLFRRDAYFGWSRKLLIGIVIFAHVFPFIPILLDLQSVRTYLPAFTYPEINITASENTTSSTLPSLWMLLLSLYVVGVGWLVYRFGRELLHIRSLQRNSAQKEWKGISLFVHNKELAPFSFYKSIYLNTEDEQHQSRESLLIHESIHIREKHSLDILLLKALKIIFWFNPVYLLFDKELRIIHEYVCDKRAVEFVPESEYRSALLSYSLNISGIPITHSFNQLKLKRRFSMMKKQKSGRLRFKVMLLIPALGITTLFLCSMIPIEPTNHVIRENTTPRAHTTTAPQQAQQPDENIVPPSYPGGNVAMATFLSQNINYPEEAKNAGITGTVYVTFVIKKNGQVSKAKVKRGIDNPHNGARLMENEALRVVELMPNWNPASKNGKAVKMQLALPVKFNLD